MYQRATHHLFEQWGESNAVRASRDFPRVYLKLGSKGGHQSDEGSTERHEVQPGQVLRANEAAGGWG